MSEISIAIADDNLQTLSLLNDILEGEEDFHVVGRRIMEKMLTT